MATRFHNGSFGVMDANGHRFASKKALRELIRTNPQSVGIEDLSMFGSAGPEGAALWTAADIPPGIGYRTIAGPDPHTNRKWYASIERTEDGILKVK